MRGLVFALMLLVAGCSGAATEQVSASRTEPSIEGLEAAVGGLEQRHELLDELRAVCGPRREIADAARCQQLYQALPPVVERGLLPLWADFEVVCHEPDNLAAAQKRCAALEQRLRALQKWWRYYEIPSGDRR